MTIFSSDHSGIIWDRSTLWYYVVRSSTCSTGYFFVVRSSAL